MGFIALSAEIQLVLAIAAFYLYDSSLMLSYEEGLLLREPGRWRVRFSTEGPFAARRFLHWPPLFRLHVQVHRLKWRSDRIHLQASQSAQAWEASARELKNLPLLAYAQAVNLFIFLPLALFYVRNNAVLLVVAGLIYLVGLAQAVCVWRGGERWGLEKKATRAIAVEVLLCPPLGVNLVRKVSLQMPCQDNLLAAAASVMSEAHFKEVRLRAVALIEDELLDHDEDSQAAQRLKRSIDTLSGAHT